MTTYSVNADIELDNGKSLDEAFGDISQADIILKKNNVRERAYQEINNKWLKGKSAVPATLLEDQLKYIEIDLALSNLLGATYTQEKPNQSKWVDYYRDRAENYLKNLRIPSSADVPTTHSENTGNGTINIHSVNDGIAETEYWELVCISNSYFSAIGSKSGKLAIDIEIGEYYPLSDVIYGTTDYGMRKLGGHYAWNKYPFQLTITNGSTDFAVYDRFTFWTYKASYKSNNIGTLWRG